MTTTESILDIFQNFRQTPLVTDQYEVTGKTKLDDRLSTFVANSRPIDFVMLGFPFKSTNRRDKVLGPLPDLGEELTFKQFQDFDKQVKAIYNPGIRMHMVSDGFVFNDILGVSDSEVDEYLEICKDLSVQSPVQWHTLNDFYSGQLSTNRTKVMDQFAPTPEHLQQEILMNPDTNLLYRGMIRFMEEELISSKDWPSRNQLQVAAKKLTREMMFRNEAYSNLVKSEFSNSIRLSMHPSVNSGAKYSFQLIPGSKVKHSAWHSAVYINGSNIETLHKKDAVERGLVLNFKNNQPYYFTQL